MEELVHDQGRSLGPQDFSKDVQMGHDTEAVLDRILTEATQAVGAKGMVSLYAQVSPICRNITHEEVGRNGAFLLSDMSDGITGEIVHVDAGYNIMGSPGRLLDTIQ